jgi:hypothetical protein
LRPSPSDLAAGAATIASPELYEHRRMLRYVGERSASRMLGEKVGAPPGRDPSADAAWLYLADPDRRPEFERRAEQAGRAVPPERKEDVMRWIAELLTPRGLRRLRALAQELWVHAGSPCASATGQPVAVTTVNWPACWAWCVAPTSLLPCRLDGERALMLSPSCVQTLCRAQGLPHRGHPRQRGARRRRVAVHSRQEVDQYRGRAPFASNVPHYPGDGRQERLPLRSRFPPVVQHPSVHALVWA